METSDSTAFLSFTSAAGIKIFYCREIPAEARAIIIISHGYGEHAGFYREFSRFLAGHGYGVYAYDHRAHGRSEGERGHIDRFECFIEDMAAVVEQVRRENPAALLFTFGHSMGGLIAFNYGILHPSGINGQIFSGPALGKPWGTALIPPWLFRNISRLCPRVKVYHVLSRPGSRNKAYCAEFRGDPDILHYATIGFFYQFVQRGIPFARQNAERYKLPCLFLHGKKDKIIPYRSSVETFDRISSPDKELMLYDGLYHELVQEPEREQVWGDILDWLDKRTS